MKKMCKHNNSLHLLELYVLVIVLNTFHGLSYLTCTIALGVDPVIISVLWMRKPWLKDFK